MKHKILLLAASLLMAVFPAAAQQNLHGKVTDSQGEGIPGATVMISGTRQGVVTDLDGNYVIAAPSNATLEFSFIGMKTLTVQVGNRSQIDVTLEDDSTVLDEVVVVGFGTQAKVDLTNAVSTMKGAELLKAPTSGITNMVGTRVAGVVALQQSGQPGNDAASLLVRGQGAVCIVDGVQRDLNEIEPNEIESISVLKDATSASIYGLNCSAVILVTTKRGDVQKARISYNGEYGISQNTDLIKMLDGPQYAYWYNKCLELDAEAKGQAYTPIFTAETVQYMREGSHGWGNTDWYGNTFGIGTTQHHNVTASGGTDKAKFFASVGYFNQNGNVKNFGYERYNLRSNVDAKITESLRFELNVAARIEKRTQPHYSANPDDWHNIPQQAVRALPYVPATYEIDGVTYNVATPTNSSPVSPVSADTETGYYNADKNYIQTNASLIWDVPFVKGLQAKFMASYDYSTQTTKSLSTPCFQAHLILPTAGTTDLRYYKALDCGFSGQNPVISESNAWSWNLTTQTSLNYDRSFGKHRVKALALMETRENKSHTFSASGQGLDFLQLPELSRITRNAKDANGNISLNPDSIAGDALVVSPTVGGYSGNSRMAGFVGRINYDYAEKYLLEASVRYDGSYVFSGKAGNRWVVLPGVSAGWRISKEDWFNVPAIQELKLRGSVGLTANSSIAAYQYMDLVSLSKNQVVIGGASQSMVYASTLGNPGLTWAKVLNYDLGFDFEAWNGLLGIEADVFYKYEYDILSSVTGSYSPSRGGYYFSYGNENKKDYRGFDVTIRHNNYIGDFNYGAKLVLTYAYRRWLYYAGDADNTPDYLKLTGKEVGAQKGFIAVGLFKSDEEAKSSATVPGYAVTEGYIKYLDRNGDGQITGAQDQGYVGASAYPKLQGSLNLFASWKGFDIDMLWQGAAGRTVSLTGQYTASGSEGIMDNTFLTKPFYHGGNSPLFLLENSWTHENPDGEFPRPSIDYLSNNNGWSSTFWYRDGSYLRLKTLQIGYTFPQKWTKHVGMSQLRIYAQGSNLLTFSELTKYHIDPEQPGVNNGYYPQQKVYQMGVKITF